LAPSHLPIWLDLGKPYVLHREQKDQERTMAGIEDKRLEPNKTTEKHGSLSIYSLRRGGGGEGFSSQMRSSTAEVTSKLNLDGSPTSPAHSEQAQIVTYKRGIASKKHVFDTAK
jgi:hypothetical protein